jgi:hypothetical protein
MGDAKARLSLVQVEGDRRVQRTQGSIQNPARGNQSVAEKDRDGNGDEDRPVSIQAILGLSVDRLERTDQERFAMLAVFGGEPLTWEINAAAAVWECSQTEAERTTSQLIQRGLVEPRPSGRYWMHALLSDYAQELLERVDL